MGVQTMDMKAPMGARLHIFHDVPSLADAFARRLVELASGRTREQGVFTLALTGGETPGPFYRRLADPEFRSVTPWDCVKIFFGDERSVGPESPRSNFKLAWETWLEYSPIPRESIFRLRGEAASLAEAAEEYSQILEREVPGRALGFPSLDLILLGLGPDGHIASLFPDTAALNETLRTVVANEVPQQDTWRLTFTFPLINAAREVWFLVTESRKADVVARALGYHPEGAVLPAALVHPVGGNVHWWLDRGAASALPEPQLKENIG